MILAYLDAATGGMLIQSLIAAAVAIPFILRAQIARGVERLRGLREPKGPDDTPAGNK